MAHHSVELHKSFVEQIDHLDESIHDSLGVILKALEEDPYFQPNEEDYIFYRDAEAGICTCQHISDWDEWQLSWFYEYFPYYESTIQTVVVMLTRQPFQRLQPKKVH